MGSVCAEQHHKFHRHHHRSLEIPPRKLLGREAADCLDVIIPQPSLQKFFPGGGDDDSSNSDSDPYSSDHFRMFEFKVRRCTRSKSHDWTDCPFVHPGEKARRRDPRKYHYSGTVCLEYRCGSCSRGENCEFSHGVFECWLHPSRYRTEACKDGENCKRKVCFFAHTPHQLRVIPVEPDNPPPVSDRKYQAEQVPIPLGQPHPHCCVLCQSVNNSSSPTSILLSMSHLSPPLSPSASLSPPLSPLKNQSLAGISPVSRYPDRFIVGPEPIGLSRGGGRVSNKDVLNEIMNNFDSIQLNERIGSRNLAWLDVCNLAVSSDNQPQFIFSPSTPNPPARRDCFGTHHFANRGLFFDDKSDEGVPGSAEPDIGWVDELLM